MKTYMGDFYQNCRPAVISGLLSLQFIHCLKTDQNLEAIKLIQTSELKHTPFPSVDEQGKPIALSALDLTKLFCLNKESLQNSTGQTAILASPLHVNAVCDFINKELLAYERDNTE